MVLTRNLADFEATGVALLNPWQQDQTLQAGWFTVPPADRCG